ncbi:transposase family protein [Streptomyces sp. UG1]|uniref:transposase family protein n=1 Tax=Streptomyces sp. UG1 TaxID=3417652 RepID=UPI003CE87B1F
MQYVSYRKSRVTADDFALLHTHHRAVRHAGGKVAPIIITGRKATRSHRLTDAENEANRLVSRERAAVEHGFANLKTWRILTKVRMNVHHATTLLRALLVLANCEVQR